MTSSTTAKFATALLASAACAVMLAAQSQPASQAPAAAAPAGFPGAADRAAMGNANLAERDREMKLLGIAAIQPGVTAYDIGKPGNANYDEAKANPFPNLPDALTLKNGEKITLAEMWWRQRRRVPRCRWSLS